MKQFKISIPKPCHEDWNAMTPQEKGRFCSSCAKTVIDFTKKSNQEIQDYLMLNRGQRVCGHFYRKQLDSIVIQIPDTSFSQHLSFQKLFILSLLLAMGTTLFSCKTETGKVQKIEKVELIDSIIKTEQVLDSVTEPENNLLGELPNLPNSCKKDSVLDIQIEGLVEEIGEVMEVPLEPYSIYEVDTPPSFKETTTISKEKLIRTFDAKIKDLVIKNFDISTTRNLDLSKGKKRIYIKFTINKNGKATDFQARAPHPFLKKKMIALFDKLPDFIPAKKDGKNVSVSYVQPIIFEVE